MGKITQPLPKLFIILAVTVTGRQEPMGPNLGDSQSSPFNSLEVDLITNIISCTTPRDACVVASVSKNFESAAKSDIVWEKFLPPDYESRVPRSRHFSSKKELYLFLSDNPLLIDDGKKSFGLDKASGKNCIMLSTMEMSILGQRNPNPHYWKWIQISESRFEKVAELLEVCWFEIRGRTNTRLLSPRTCYSAYIVFKKLERCYGFEYLSVQAGVGVVGKKISKRLICFDLEADFRLRIPREGGRGYINIVKPEERKDGWMETELGRFFYEGGLMNSDEIELSATGTDWHNWKGGLIIQGIEIRPTRMQSSPFVSLAMDLISNIISFTSPLDACVVASVSKNFEFAAKSDIVWEKFLPQEYESLVPPSQHFSLKKELYLSLCDDGEKSWWLEKASGKSCIRLSVMDMCITWGDTTIIKYWQWIQIPESSSEKVAELLDVSWFDISGTTNTRLLSPRTCYSAYIVFKKQEQCYGFEDWDVEVGVGFAGQKVSDKFICFDVQDLVEPEEREDGWMEIKLGEFFNEGGLINSDEIQMRALGSNEHTWERGLIIRGIEIRPTKMI